MKVLLAVIWGWLTECGQQFPTYTEYLSRFQKQWKKISAARSLKTDDSNSSVSIGSRTLFLRWDYYLQLNFVVEGAKLFWSHSTSPRCKGRSPLLFQQMKGTHFLYSLQPFHMQFSFFPFASSFLINWCHSQSHINGALESSRSEEARGTAQLAWNELEGPVACLHIGRKNRGHYPFPRWISERESHVNETLQLETKEKKRKNSSDKGRWDSPCFWENTDCVIKEFCRSAKCFIF